MRMFYLMLSVNICQNSYIEYIFKYKIKNMGNQQPKKNGQYFSIENLHREVDKFCSSQLTKQQFLKDLFPEIESSQHPIGSVSVINTYIMERFYLVAAKNRNGANVNCENLKRMIEKMYRNPQKAIEYSFRLIDLDGDNYITNAEFLNFMDNCFISLMWIVENQIKDANFKIQLRQWTSKNKKPVLEHIISIFKKNLKSDPERWTYGDYKKWVLDGQNWTFDIQLEPYKFRTPLNLLCLFAIPLNK